MEKYNLLEICDVYQPKTIATKNFVTDGKYIVYGANGAIGRYNQYNHKNSEVMMACRGATCGAINISKPFSWINGNAMVIHPNGQKPILQKYLMYCLEIADKKRIISGTAQPQITRTNLIGFQIPVCDIEEQERIVTRIEELFSELDKAVETLKTTKQQLAIYRQAVLKEAFRDITKKKTIRELSSFVTSGSRGWAKYYADTGARFIRITDLTRDSITLKDDSIQYVKLPNVVEGKRSKLIQDDVLVSITADLGSIALIPQNIGEAYINQHIAMIRFKNTVQSEYMAWYLKSTYGQKDLLKNKRGGGKLGLGLDDIRDTKVPIITDSEALNVVSKIDYQLGNCNQIEKTVDTALQQAEALRQSILKQAFEGRL